ncbi:hypothetical protein [Thermoflexus sp.]|uniref:hypothetical protein n=1 Tax=Thermoflexus sp. TaxID=1969742 RepID=UPI0035E3F537
MELDAGEALIWMALRRPARRWKAGGAPRPEVAFVWLSGSAIDPRSDSMGSGRCDAARYDMPEWATRDLAGIARMLGQATSEQFRVVD